MDHSLGIHFTTTASRYISPVWLNSLHPLLIPLNYPLFKVTKAVSKFLYSKQCALAYLCLMLNVTNSSKLTTC